MINRVYIIIKYFTVFPMFDPEELNSKINQSFKNQEKAEDLAPVLVDKLLETLILTIFPLNEYLNLS